MKEVPLSGEIIRSEERFRAFVLASSDVVYQMSPDWSEMRHLWGKYFIADTTEATKGWIEKYILPEDRPFVMAAIQRAIETKSVFELEHRVIRVDGTVGWTFSRAIPICDANGEIQEWFGAASDITERKRAEEALLRANQDLEEFAYATTHDLQEPARTIRLFSDWLAKKYAASLDGQALDTLQLLAGCASRMETLIQDLFAYTQAGRSTRVTQRTEATACLKTAIRNLSASIKETEGTVTFDPLPSVKIQRTRLEQVFQNLIGNALKYRRPQVPPVVHVSARVEDGVAHFIVADNGIGIEEQYREHIFGLFKRLHGSGAYSGTGIGLSLCRRIIERNHGQIWVESKVGEGSRFHFTVPV